MSVFDVNHLLTVEQLADIAQTEAWSIREECRTGKLRGSKRRGKWLIEPADAQAWFEDGVPSAAERPERKSPPAPGEYGSLRDLNAA